MVEETDPSTTPGQAGLTCPRCGAPLPRPGEDGFASCTYCGVRTEVSPSSRPQREPFPPEAATPPREPPLDWAEDDDFGGDSSHVGRVVIALVAIVLIIAIAAFATSQPQSNSTGSAVAHCSVSINASAMSGPAPFTATFTADVTTPPGDSAGGPMWQFGPFGGGFDLNYTYGSTVTHTWDTSGTYGVHVTVEDSSGLGCWTAINVDVI